MDYGYTDTCCFCDEEYDWCECEPFEDGFEFEGFMIFEPNVDVSGDYLVDPEVYYGEAYIKWFNSRDRSRHHRTAREDDKRSMGRGVEDVIL